MHEKRPQHMAFSYNFNFNAQKLFSYLYKCNLDKYKHNGAAQNEIFVSGVEDDTQQAKLHK